MLRKIIGDWLLGMSGDLRADGEKLGDQVPRD
jgi:hypothetical protein